MACDAAHCSNSEAAWLIIHRMPIFLFNYTDKMMYGIFRAVTPGTQNINPQGIILIIISLLLPSLSVIFHEALKAHVSTGTPPAFVCKQQGKIYDRLTTVLDWVLPTVYIFCLSGWTSISHTSTTRYPAQVRVELFEKCCPIVDRQVMHTPSDRHAPVQHASIVSMPHVT